MAVSGVTVPAGEIADRNAGFPLAFGSHAGDALVLGTSRWAATATAVFGDADNTAVNFPVRWATDRRGYKRTKPATTATGHTLLLDLGTSASDIDVLMLWGYAGLDGVTVSIEVADTADFVTNPVTIGSFVFPASDRTRRVVLAQLSDGVNAEARLSGVQFMRLKFTKGSGFTPEIGEVWLGRRRQFWNQPLAGTGFSPNMIGSLSSKSGPGQSSTTYVKARAHKILEAAFRSSNTTEVDIVKDLNDDTEQGTRHFCWIFDPSTTDLDDECHVMDPQTELYEDPVGIGEFIREHIIDGAEQAPFLKLETIP